MLEKHLALPLTGLGSCFFFLGSKCASIGCIDGELDMMIGFSAVYFNSYLAMSVLFYLRDER